MRQQAGKLWISMLLAIALTASSFLAPMAVAADIRSDSFVAEQLETSALSATLSSARCHQAIGCENSVAFQFWYDRAISETVIKLSVPLTEPNKRLAGPETRVPPPKA